HDVLPEAADQRARRVVEGRAEIGEGRCRAAARATITTSGTAPSTGSAITAAASTSAATWIRRHRSRLRRRNDVGIGAAVRLEIIASDIRRVGGELLDRRVDLAGILRLKAVNQRLGRNPGGAVNPEFVPEARRPQAALRLVEGVGIFRKSLDLLHQA